MSNATASSCSGGGDTGTGSPWAWLGLLKWSLSYADGTKPSSESMKPMSDEDRKFLEAVMKEGIIDENERMKTILTEVTEYLEMLRETSSSSKGGTEDRDSLATKKKEEEEGNDSKKEERIRELLQELRDIVEQIDYARTFAAMGGSQFLVGCASERDVVPISVRTACLGVLATLCQNNPPVQTDMLNRGYINALCNLYLAEGEEQWNNFDQDENHTVCAIRSRIVQALSCSVRGHVVAEQLFSENELGREVIQSGLGMHDNYSTTTSITAATKSLSYLALQKRCLFFLQALVTSDTSSYERVQLFGPCIAHVCDRFLDDRAESDAEVREMSLGFLTQVLKQKKSVNVVLDRKDAIASLGVQRISALRSLEGEEREYAAEELEQWESLIVESARGERDNERDSSGGDRENNTATSAAPLLLEDDKITAESLPQ